MGQLVRDHWEAGFEGMGRRDRSGCDFDVFVPDVLATWDPAIPADVAADIADAETAVRSLNDAGIHHVSLEGMARFLLRAESVASSKIEGLDAVPAAWPPRRWRSRRVATRRSAPAGQQQPQPNEGTT